MVTYTRFAATVLLLALQLSQVLGGVASCGSVAGTSRLIPPPQDAPLTAASDLALDTWADLLWIAAGDTLHQLRYSTGEHIMALELPAAGGIRRHDLSALNPLARSAWRLLTALAHRQRSLICSNGTGNDYSTLLRTNCRYIAATNSLLLQILRQ